eukprot:6213342-Pleurochrysis_carterae.AAC.2
MTKRTGRLAVLKADKGRPCRLAVSCATSQAKVRSVWNARPPSAVIERPCSRVSSRISGRNFESGGKMLGTYKTSPARWGLYSSGILTWTLVSGSKVRLAACMAETAWRGERQYSTCMHASVKHEWKTTCDARMSAAQHSKGRTEFQADEFVRSATDNTCVRGPFR